MIAPKAIKSHIMNINLDATTDVDPSRPGLSAAS
jgi:hypothetical protein